MKIVLVALNSSYTHTNSAVRIFANLLSERHDVSIFETTVNEKGGVLALCERLYKMHADLYAFSVYIWNKELQLALAKNIKKLLPNCKIVVGGPEVSFCEKDFLVENDYIDYLIKGEGEKAICDIADEKYEPKCIVDGGVYEDFSTSDEPYFCAKHPTSCPDGSLLYYETSRGCPYNCSYCLSSVKREGERVRAKKVELVKKELSVLLSKNIRTLKFVDRTFNFDKERAVEIFSFIIDFEKNFGKCPTCHFEICASLLDEKTIDLLSKAPAGLFRFEIGVQTATPETLLEIGRRDDTEKIIANVKKLKEKTFVTVHLDLICGLPFDTYEKIGYAFDRIYGISDHLQVGVLKLLHGTKMRRNAQKYGMRFLEDPPYTLLFSDTFSFEQMRKLEKIADMVETFSEEGCGFYQSCDFLVSKSSSPFALFEKLSEFFPDDENISHREKYLRLCRFGCELLSDHDKCILKEKLRYDFLVSNQGKVPSEFDRIYTAEEKRFLEEIRTSIIHEAPKGESGFFVPALETHLFAFDDPKIYLIDRKNKLVQTRDRSCFVQVV